METWTVDASHLGRSVCLGFGISALICLAATTWAKHTLEPALRRTPRPAVRAAARSPCVDASATPAAAAAAAAAGYRAARGTQWPEVAVMAGC